MPSNKKQHYVPRFYLRNFSWDDQKAINIYNKKSGKLIANGNLSNQCYEPYFYGKNLIVEDAFGDLEGVVSKIIGEILDGNSPPLMKSAGHHALLVHTLFQFSRTKHAASAHDEMIEKLLKNIFEKEQTIPAEELAKVRIGFKNSIALALKTTAECIPIAYDLKYKVLRNTTSLQFLMSDNPVVFYNTCYERSRFGSHTGLAAKGFQILLPLSPRHLLIFYDGATYKIGEKKKLVVDVVAINDIRQMNDLQWLNSLENIYFHRDFSRAELESARRKNEGRQNSEKAVLNEYPQGEHPSGTSSSILHMHRPDHKIALSLQCVRPLWKAPDTELNAIPKLLRNPILCRLHEEFLQLVSANKYKASEFSKFINNKANSNR